MNSNTKLLLALLAGATAGVVIGLLIAPEKGSDTREKINDRVKKLADEIIDKAGKAIDDFEEVVKK